MKRWSVKCAVWALVAAAGAGTLSAQAVTPPATPNTARMTRAEKKNLDLVLDWWREVIESGHVELAPKYQAADYIQHNPNVSTGRAAFVQFFSRIGRPRNPIPSTLQHPPVVMGAKGDFVWLMFENRQRDPRDSTRTSRFNSFDLLRIQHGKVQEHWDSARKMPGSGVVVAGVSPRAPMQWNVGKRSKEERETLAAATASIKDQAQSGPPVLMLIDGPYALMMWERTARDPDDPAREYQWHHFDLIRVERGVIQEHWAD
jgi:predicted SnoaL-like aldol condensation-catalyzing enzyme